MAELSKLKKLLSKTDNAAEGVAKPGLLETVDKYTGRPVRAAAYAALQGENPLDAARESIVRNKDTSGRQVARAFLERVEEAGMPVRAPGMQEFPLEQPLGFAADMTMDLTGAIPVGKFGKIAQMVGKSGPIGDMVRAGKQTKLLKGMTNAGEDLTSFNRATKALGPQAEAQQKLLTQVTEEQGALSPAAQFTFQKLQRLISMGR